MKFIKGRYYRCQFNGKYLCEDVQEGIEVSFATLMDLSIGCVVLFS